MTTTGPGRRTVRFHLTGGQFIDIDMTPDELRNTMRAIDNDGLIGNFNVDQNQQVWARGRHISLIEHPYEMGVDWIAIHGERATPDNPQLVVNGGGE